MQIFLVLSHILTGLGARDDQRNWSFYHLLWTYRGHATLVRNQVALRRTWEAHTQRPVIIPGYKPELAPGSHRGSLLLGWIHS